jgi:hypothetical protein
MKYLTPPVVKILEVNPITLGLNLECLQEVKEYKIIIKPKNKKHVI